MVEWPTAVSPHTAHPAGYPLRTVLLLYRLVVVWKDAREKRMCGEYTMHTFQLVRLLSRVDGRKQDVCFLDIAPFVPGVLQHGRSDRQYKHTGKRTPGRVGCVWRYGGRPFHHGRSMGKLAQYLQYPEKYHKSRNKGSCHLKVQNKSYFTDSKYRLTVVGKCTLLVHTYM